MPSPMTMMEMLGTTGGAFGSGLCGDGARE